MSVADAPVSLGTHGAIERATLNQGSSRKGSAASFGTPAYNESRGFGFRLRIPLYVGGDLAGESIVPFSNNTVRAVPGASGLFEDQGLGVFTNEDMSSIGSFIPAIEIGDERKSYHFQAGALSARIGHGSIIHYFTNSPEGGDRRFGLMGELNSASLGAQVMMADVTSPATFVGGRVYGRPILWFVAPDSLVQPNDIDLDPRAEAAGIWVTGVTAAADFDAPAASGGRAISWAAGWDNELALLDNKLIRLIGRLDLNALGGVREGAMKDVPAGFGAHPGVRFALDVPVLFNFEIEAEYNAGTRGYVPRYFDRLYFLERDQMFGSSLSKAAIAAPASHGYQIRAAANIVKTLSLFVETQDQFPFYSDEGSNSAMLTGGASFWFLFFGASATLSQAGVRNYLSPQLFGSGFILTAEARVALVANIVHIVGRHYRVHDPLDVDLENREYDVLTGTLVGLEVNFDMNTPFPFF